MRYPSRDDPELVDSIRRYVHPGGGARRRYLKLLHGNFGRLDDAERSDFLGALVEDAYRITDHELGVLLSSEWRARLTAGWLIGVGRRDGFRVRLETMLLASEVVYSGQGYCFALARLGTEEDAEILAAYLDHYLPWHELQYDQAWALGTLLHLDERLGSGHADRFLRPGGLWEQWAEGRFDAQTQKRRADELIALVERVAAEPE